MSPEDTCLPIQPVDDAVAAPVKRRAERRVARRRALARATRLGKGQGSIAPLGEADLVDWARRATVTPVRCSKPCCSSRREWHGPTIQERRAALDVDVVEDEE